ncbi:MAG TPA: hypothetical protein VGL57_14540 [Solirubrobacteraceae bacterium]|jgi:hypothetical protein
MNLKGILTLLLAFGALLAAASSASALEAQPLTITKFTIEPTEQTVIKGTRENIEIINEPYKTPFTQAGGHPWALTTTGEFATREIQVQHEPQILPTQDPKDIVTNLPPGLLGDPMAVPRCSLAQVVSAKELCPADTQVGVYLLHRSGGVKYLAPIVNVTPEVGQSAEFALENTLGGIDTPLLTGHLVRTRQGYGFTVVSNEIPAVGLFGFELTFWGVPGDPSHDALRGLVCHTTTVGSPLGCGEQGGGEHFGYSPVVPFLTLGTDCSAGSERATMRADSWEEPGSVGPGGQYSEQWREASSTMPALTGCNRLSFDPSVGVEPDTLLPDEPVGLGVNVGVPLNENPESTATPQLRDTTLTLPEGMSVSPGVVDGIRACEAEGPEGIDIEGPESEEPGLNGELELAAGHCPDASVVGTAEAITPLLAVPVKGHVYLAKPGCGGAGQNPCTEQDALDGNLYRLYLELGGTGELAQTGVHFKVALATAANPATGQLTTRVLGTPQAPFSELKIHLNGGPRAPIANPAACGPAVTTADFTPWSAPGQTPAPESLFTAGTPDATPSSFFDVEGCAGTPSLAPGFTAGTVIPQAGQFSAFTLDLSRQDREQYVKGIQVHTPPGLLGMLSSVPLCEESAAEDGHCSEASKIGTTRVASGAGSHPFEIEGNVYLTKGYGGAPFGLSIVTHAVAGPFNLGLVVVRARIAVDPETSALTITTDETGAYAIPQILDGVPLRLQRVTVNIDRSNFMFNPTNCGAPGQPGVQRVTAVVSGAEDAKATVASQFAVGGCKSLAFKPSFTVFTSGKTSKVDGASLDAKLSYPAGSVGSEANIARVKVDLPRQLPSRLTTLQKACAAQTFEANPANCPTASIVGVVRAGTPLLPVGLSGPVYFVSHGGEAFPSLIVVLQGDGVRVDLTGATFISKTGITSSTFKTVPDVPVNTFEIYLPEGKYSALAANGNLCKLQSGLKMPTELVAQNGAVLHQITKVTVTGCPKAKKAAKPRKKHVKAKKVNDAGHGRTR